jgi:hypothetical protein
METHLTNNFCVSFGSVNNYSITLKLKNVVQELPINTMSLVGFRQKRNFILGLPGTAGGLVILFYLMSNSHMIGRTEMLIYLIVCLIITLRGVARRIAYHEKLPVRLVK